jgi:predicted nucleic acid-binding protein
MDLCVDASVALKWVLAGEPLRNEALALLQRSIESGDRLIAPPLFAAEVDSVVRRYAHTGVLDPVQETAAWLLLDAAPVTLVDEPAVRPRARAIARQFNQRFVYDSIYAALAEAIGCEFWTADMEFHKAVVGHLPFVRHLSSLTP